MEGYLKQVEQNFNDKICDGHEVTALEVYESLGIYVPDFCKTSLKMVVWGGKEGQLILPFHRV